MKPNSIISLYGAYAHWRNSFICHVAFIKLENNKILAGFMVTKIVKEDIFKAHQKCLKYIKSNIKQIEINKANKFLHDRVNKSCDLN